KTPGTDRKTIAYLQQLTEEELVGLVRTELTDYKPRAVRRVNIPKSNGKTRPLGIPTVLDRLIQQAIRQVIEPICEAKFYAHSYGFRPLRGTKHAIARTAFLVNRAKYHYAVDIDIKGFFDNVNHRILLKQMWNMGIQDRRLLKIIHKMLKAPIRGIGIPLRGTPQGGILSPLLANVVLNDLDWWVANQWEFIPTRIQYSKDGNKRQILRRTTKLKEGFIVRYADDFKILTKDYHMAKKWFHGVKGYLKDRLKLDISPEKSKIVNLRKKKSEFLGFTIRAIPKSKKWICMTGISEKKKQAIKIEAKRKIVELKKSPTAQNAMTYNAYILGIHNYFRVATHVHPELSKVDYQLSTFLYNRMRRISQRG
ncbi:group II intron reverse transcriptase/maturase, partial [Paenibacillus larvae]